MKKVIRPARAWAWAILGSVHKAGPYELCRWAEPSKEVLLMGQKPSPEAIAVRVELTPVTHKKRRKVEL